MAKRGRKSPGDLSVVTPITVPRVSPPASCPPAARGEFVAIVSAAPAAAFKPSDAELVVRLATTRIMIRSATSAAEMIQLARLELALCRALRLTPNARTDKTVAGTQFRRHQPSVYDALEAEG